MLSEVQSINQTFPRFFPIKINQEPKQKEIRLKPDIFEKKSVSLPVYSSRLHQKELFPNGSELVGYFNLTDAEKLQLRQECKNFNKVGHSEKLYVPNKKYIPLSFPGEMKDFLNIVNEYNKVKEHRIISLGRSPKWFLDTSTWMKDGIKDYSFVAFSKYWYEAKKDFQGGEWYLEKAPRLMPTDGQEAAYKLYLKFIKSDPLSIVKKAQETGNSVIITDYVERSKGFTSFLDLQSRFAKKQGVLSDFTKSIEFFKLASREYTEDRFYMIDENVPTPHVILPETMSEIVPYERGLPLYPKQDYFDVPFNIFNHLMLNENANECRSTSYSKDFWLMFKPCHTKFECNPGTKRFRNLITFTILDHLNANNLIRRL